MQFCGIYNMISMCSNNLNRDSGSGWTHRHWWFVSDYLNRNHSSNLAHHIIHQIIPRWHQAGTINMNGPFGTLNFDRRVADLGMEH
jgi:hypothetical protein